MAVVCDITDPFELRLDFAVIGHQRCGSTYFCDLLNSHPSIVCVGEAFNPGFTLLDLSVIQGQTRYVWSRERRDIDSRDQHLQSYMNLLRERSHGRILGAKVFHEHNPTVVSAIAETRIPLIILKRNYLYSYSSWRLATQTHVWHRTSDDRALTHCLVDFDIEEFVSWCQVNDRFYQRFSRADVLELWYEDIFRDETLCRVADYLGVGKGFRRESVEYRQVSPNDLNARFNRFEDVVAKLQHTVYRELLPSYGRKTGCGCGATFAPIR